MRSYLARRVLQSAVLFVLITMITFTVIRLAPGGPAILANPNLTKAQMTTLRAGLGLEDPIPVQYARWMKQVLQGEFGNSFNESVPVKDLIRERLEGKSYLHRGMKVTFRDETQKPAVVAWASTSVNTWIGPSATFDGAMAGWPNPR